MSAITVPQLPRHALEHEPVQPLDGWARHLVANWRGGGVLLVAGNGGSAALAGHLVAELVGRYDRDRSPLAAVWLGADACTSSAIVNDFGADELFARQVEAFVPCSPVVLLMSSSGRSSNLLVAAERAGAHAVSVLAMTGALPNPLAAMASSAIAVSGPTALVQEVQQWLVHELCTRIEAELERTSDPTGVEPCAS